MSTVDQTEDEWAFQEIGRHLGTLFTSAVRHAAGASPAVAALLIQRYRDRQGVRAVFSLDAAAGVVDFEFRGNDGVWRSFIALKGEVPPELRPN